VNVGFIGTGRITRRLVRGLDASSHGIAITRRSESVSSELVAENPGIEVLESAQAVVDRSDAVFVCLAAEVAREVLPGLRFGPDHAVISVMAGMSLEALRGAAAPAGDVSVTIPMPVIEQGGCPLPVYPASASLEALYGERNPVIPVADESALDPFWPVSGTVASLIEELRIVTAWLAERIGDPDAAERYVTHLYGAQFAYLKTGHAGRLDAALEDLSIGGGFNATLRERIEESGHYDELRTGLDALYERVKTG
jgi:pyrroline-5-carboxylate reductase